MRKTPLIVMDAMKSILDDIENGKINYRLLPTVNKAENEYIGIVHCTDNTPTKCTLLIKEITRCGACMAISINLQCDDINILCAALTPFPLAGEFPDYITY